MNNSFSKQQETKSNEDGNSDSNNILTTGEGKYESQDSIYYNDTSNNNKKIGNWQINYFL